MEITRSLEAGASIEAADEEGKTALMLAAEGGHAEAMRALIEAGANSVACGNPTGWGSYQCWTVIGRAIGSSNPEAVRVALQVWATLPSGWWKHDPGVTRAILSHCLERGSCRLDDFLSDIVHNDEMVALSLSAGADPNLSDSGGVTPLMGAVANPVSVRLLIEGGANVNVKDNFSGTALMAASRRRAEESIRLLIANGADVNARDNSGRTALMEAFPRGTEESIRLLIANGADVNARDNSGRTALMEAFPRGTEESIRLLIANGADVNARDNSGRTALMEASRKGTEETVRRLLSAGAEINTVSNEGWSALHAAVGAGNLPVVQELVDSGADIEIGQEPPRVTPLLTAIELGRSRIALLLLEKGARIEEPTPLLERAIPSCAKTRPS